MTNKPYSLGSQARYLFISKLIAFTFQFFTPIILTRLFSIDEYGIYRQIITFSLMFPVIFSLGLDNSLYYFYPIQSGYEKHRQLLTQSFYLMLLSGIVFLAAYFVLHNIIFQFWENGQRLTFYALPIGLYVTFSISSLIIDTIFVVEQKPTWVLGFNIINGILRFLLICGAALIFEDLSMQVWALVIGEFARTLVLFYYLKTKYRIRISILDKDFIKKQLKYSLPIGLSMSISTFANKMETYMMLLFVNPVQFAIYSVANFRLPYINMLYGAIANVALMRISEYAKSNNYHEALKLWHKAIVNQAAITFPSVVFFIFMAPSFILLLFTSKYQESISLFRIILLAPLAQIFASTIIIKAYNQTKYLLRIQTINFIFSVAASYFLIKYFGLIGAAICAVSTFYLTVFMETIIAKKILHTSLINCLPYRDLLIILLISIVAFLPLIILNNVNLLNIVRLLIVGIVYFPGIFLIFHYMKFIDLLPIFKKIESIWINSRKVEQ